MAARPDRALVTAIVIVLLVGGWIASGVLWREAPAAAAVPEPSPMRVTVVASTAQPVERVLVLQGTLEPDTLAVIRAETSGQVLELPAARGAHVVPGDVIAELEPGDRQARLHRAQAALAQAGSDHEATQRLLEQGHIPRLQAEARLAALRAAEADLEAIRLDIARTRITAPVGGILNRRLVERGEWLAVGDPIVELVESDPLRAVVQVPQMAIHRVFPGGEARIEVYGRSLRSGTIRFIDVVADPATRTFRVEVEVPNPDRRLPAGISAQVEIPTDVVHAHRVSPAILGLSDSGEVGVTTVSEDDRAMFHAVTIVRADPDGVWITGLPETTRIITVGQGFVRDGEQIMPITERTDDATQP